MDHRIGVTFKPTTRWQRPTRRGRRLFRRDSPAAGASPSTAHTAAPVLCNNNWPCPRPSNSCKRRSAFVLCASIWQTSGICDRNIPHPWSAVLFAPPGDTTVVGAFFGVMAAVAADRNDRFCCSSSDDFDGLEKAWRLHWLSARTSFHP